MTIDLSSADTLSTAGKIDRDDSSIPKGFKAENFVFVGRPRVRPGGATVVGATRTRSVNRFQISGESVTGGSNTTSPQSQQDEVVIPPKVVRRTSEQMDVFTSLQTWEGVVDEVFFNYFRARLIDVNTRLEESVELPIEEISPPDKELLKEGAIFYWSIGYQQRRNGQKLRLSLLRFRRVKAKRAGIVRVSESWEEGVEDAWLSVD